MMDYYVYLHRRKDTNEVFYVGHGRLNRAYIQHKRSNKWLSVANLNGYNVEFFKSNLTKSEAISIENDLLRNPDPTWSLVNMKPPVTVLNLNFEYFNEWFEYCPDSRSGLKWKKLSGKNSKGSHAGSLSKEKYWQVRLHNKLYTVHRIIWLLNHGSIDNELVINHIDNNKANNNIKNLEQVTSAINSRRSINQKAVDISGICYTKMKSGYEYWIGYYHDINSKRKSKSFNIKLHGFDIAKQMAIEWRKSMLTNENTKGAGYNV